MMSSIDISISLVSSVLKKSLAFGILFIDSFIIYVICTKYDKNEKYRMKQPNCENLLNKLVNDKYF